MRFIAVFMLFRAADMLTTYMGVSRYGVEAEINPFNVYLINHFGPVAFIPVNLFLSLMVGFLFLYFFRQKLLYQYAIYGYFIFLGLIIFNNLRVIALI